MSKYLIKFNSDGEAEFYERGTLAQLLDSRNIAIGEPEASSLPKTINSLQFLMENLIGNNCSIIKIKHSEMLYSLKLLELTRNILPPEQYVFYIIEVDDLKDTIEIDPIIDTEGCAAASATCTGNISIQASALITELPGNC